MKTLIFGTMQLLLPLLAYITLLRPTLQQSDAPITTITLAQSYTANQSIATSKYYQLTFNTTKKLLLLTLDTNTTSTASIYLSVHYSGSNQAYFTHPDEINYTQECDLSSFDTCIVRFDNQASKEPKQVSIYFSIFANADMQYELWAVIDEIYNLNISYSYRLDFSTYESGVLKISGDQFANREEVVMVLSYNNSGLVGKFQAEAAIDQIPNTQDCCNRSFIASTVGAFNKIMKLEPIKNTQSYFLLIEGQKGTKFNLSFMNSTPSAPTLAINSSVIYITQENLTYTSNTIFTNPQLPLFIHLDAYSGYGIFKVDYCNGYLTTTFQNINGQNDQICITADQRLSCKEHMSSLGQFGLLVENIEIDIVNVVYHFGYQIGVYEGTYETFLRVNQGKYGIVLSEEANRTYPIEISQQQQLTVRYKQVTVPKTGTLLFELLECQTKKGATKCKTTLKSQNSTKGDLTFKPVLSRSYSLKISCSGCQNQTAKIEYFVQLTYNYEHSVTLQPYKLYLLEIQENQYQFYLINLTKIADQLKIIVQNNSLLTISIKKLNGDIYALSSLSVPQPTLQKYMDANHTSDILFNWDGAINYMINQSNKLIYLSVKGNQQSLYYLQYSIDVDADIPAKYTKLIEGVQNNFILNKTNTYQLLSFASHIIPFKIYVTNSPKCIKVGYSLPLNQTCIAQLPSFFTEKVVYLNISHGTNPNNFKFGVFVNSGEYVLNDRQPLIVGCIDDCFQIITVQLQRAGNVIHQGKGQIFQVKNVSNKAYNSFLPLKCDSYPCSTKINASLPNAGEMILFLQSSGIRQIEWMATPITFGDYPKKFVYDLRSWSQFNSILIYSDALQLDVYYNVINIQKNDFNTKNYKFPTIQSNEGWQYGNPLRKVQVVMIDQQTIVSKKCRQPNNYCIVAFSLYPNLTIEYNEEYFNSGIGYISSNTYQYSFPLNMPQEINQEFSMSHFAHKRSQNEVFSSVGYKIDLQPLSNCHPKLYTIPFSTNPTFQKPSYDSIVVNYTAEWINFTVLAQDECKYRVTLTNSNYDSVSQNKFYQFVPQNKMVKVLFRSQQANALGFKVQVQTDSLNQKVSYIAVNIVDQNLPFVEPSLDKSDFSAANSYSLNIPQNDTYHLYLITISTNSSGVQLIIRKDEPILLTRNQEDRQALASEQFLFYRIHCTGSLALFVTTTLQYAMITVNKNFNQTEVKHTIITSRSDPWLYINSTSNQLTTYDVTIKNMANQTANIKVMFELSDVLSFRRLYEGIITYDAFISRQEKNCYYFETPLVLGRKDIVLDFVMGKNNSQFIADCLTQNDSCVKLMYSVNTKSILIKTNLLILQTIPIVYRFRFAFIPKQNYTVCFYTPNITAINVEYYVLLNDPSMEHLIEDSLSTQVSAKQYDMYEIVEEGYNENIMIQLTSCVTNSWNQKTIVGSASFIDSSLGRYTDLADYYKTKDSIYAKLSVREGYYYLGVKNYLYNDQPSNAYTIRFQNISAQATLLATKWQLQDSRIFKIYSSNPNKSSYTIQLPELVSNDDNVQQRNLNLTYTIYLQNTTNKSSQTLPIDLVNRCPSYQSMQGMENGKQEVNPIMVKSISYSFSNISHYRNKKETPKFTFEAEELPKEFDISGRIQMQSNSQSFSYYYENNKINLNHLNNDNSMSGGFIALIVVFVSIMFVLISYVFWSFCKIKKQTKNVVQMKIIKQSTPSDSIQPTQKKDLGKGYGELVDQLT